MLWSSFSASGRKTPLSEQGKLLRKDCGLGFVSVAFGRHFVRNVGSQCGQSAGQILWVRMEKFAMRSQFRRLAAGILIAIISLRDRRSRSDFLKTRYIVFNNYLALKSMCDHEPTWSSRTTHRSFCLGTPMKIQRIGKCDRYVVLNDDGRYWAGVCWVTSLRDARVFAEREQAEKVIRVLSERQQEIANGQRLTANVTVTIRPGRWMCVDDLRRSLEQKVEIIVDSDLDIIDVEVDWDSLREERES